MQRRKIDRLMCGLRTVEVHRHEPQRSCHTLWVASLCGVRVLLTYALVIACLLNSARLPVVDAAPTMVVTTVSPNLIPANTSAPVMVTARITDVNVIPSTMQLHRVDSTGSVTVIGTLHDDGRDGDAVAGDRIFTIQVPLMLQPAEFLRVSAGFMSGLPPITSSTLCLNVISPEGIQQFLNNNCNSDTAAKFLEKLPKEHKQNWIMMSYSESLQTGTATSPRLLLPSLDFRQIFTFTLEKHANFPLADPNIVEYMQFDNATTSFRFHEIDLAAGSVRMDDPKCMKCHSGRPNWDAYDSWGGMLPFNRDRIYKGSVEAAAMRHILNLQDKSLTMKSILEQLILPEPEITRRADGSIAFSFDSGTIVIEPPIDSASMETVSYSFGEDPPSPPNQVGQGRTFFTIFHPTLRMGDEGRGVQQFDGLGGLDGNLNQQRIARELRGYPMMPVDIRPIALAIAKGCVKEQIIPSMPVDSDGIPFLTPQALAFFNDRNGMNLDQLFHDTLARRHDLPRRKADLQRLNLAGPDGLITAYGAFTDDGVPAPEKLVERIRQEVFRRPHDLGALDPTTGFMIDRERYHQDEPLPDVEVNPGINTQIALFRFFLEPLGVPVDKWSMSVRGRSRTYTFADVFSTYIGTIQTELEGSLPGPHDCPTLLTASNTQFTSLPAANATPTYTEVQRIFNRNCTECHGNFRNSAGMIHGPYKGRLDLSEGVSYSNLFVPPEFVKPGEPFESELFSRITSTGGSMMPPGGPPLSRTDIETIKRWIEGGATNP